jgi:hypothetical protein
MRKGGKAEPFLHARRPDLEGLQSPKAKPALDQDAKDALNFAQRGRPETEIGYSEQAPRLTAEQLAEFQPASIRFVREK